MYSILALFYLEPTLSLTSDLFSCVGFAFTHPLSAFKVYSFSQLVIFLGSLPFLKLYDSVL